MLWKASATVTSTMATSARLRLHLGQALAIYQRIGAPAARRVQETLLAHGLSPQAEEAPASGT